MVTGLALILAFATPVIGLFLPFTDGTERFSKLWVVVGPEHLVRDYPFNIRANVSYTALVG
jgi:hypothetical protein